MTTLVSNLASSLGTLVRRYSDGMGSILVRDRTRICTSRVEFPSPMPETPSTVLARFGGRFFRAWRSRCGSGNGRCPKKQERQSSIRGKKDPEGSVRTLADVGRFVLQCCAVLEPLNVIGASGIRREWSISACGDSSAGWKSSPGFSLIRPPAAIGTSIEYHRAHPDPSMVSVLMKYEDHRIFSDHATCTPGTIPRIGTVSEKSLDPLHSELALRAEASHP